MLNVEVILFAIQANISGLIKRIRAAISIIMYTFLVDIKPILSGIGIEKISTFLH